MALSWQRAAMAEGKATAGVSEVLATVRRQACERKRRMPWLIIYPGKKGDF